MPSRKRKQPRGQRAKTRSFREYPLGVWDRVKAEAEINNETITDVINRALVDYDRKWGHLIEEMPDDT